MESVQAAAYKINSVSILDNGDGVITLISSILPLPIVCVDAEYMAKHQPIVGGYCVICEDGYKSYLPAAAIEGAQR